MAPPHLAFVAVGCFFFVPVRVFGDQHEGGCTFDCNANELCGGPVISVSNVWFGTFTYSVVGNGIVPRTLGPYKVSSGPFVRTEASVAVDTPSTTRPSHTRLSYVHNPSLSVNRVGGSGGEVLLHGIMPSTD